MRVDVPVAGDDALRVTLEAYMSEGLETEWQDRPGTSEAVNRVVARLQSVAHDDLAGLMRVAGFTLEPYVAPGDDQPQACDTCMYFLVHRQYCELPELRLPVKPQWSCRLWRI